MHSLFPYRFEITRKSASYDVLVIYAATPTLDPDEFATVVETEIDANLVPDEIVVVVRGPSFAATSQKLATASLNLATLGRLGNRTTVTLIGYDCCGKETERQCVAGPAAKHAVTFDDFRRRAVTSIFNARHGFVESTTTYHFENPSGRHTERFIRLSNILTRGAEISFIAFCALQFIPKATTTAYLDTPSLYAVVAAVNEQRASFGDTPAILADNFASYAGIKNYQFAPHLDDAVVLISGSSSGSLAAELVETVGFPPTQITHLLFLGTDKSRSNIVCDLRFDEKKNPEGATKLPAVEQAKGCWMCAAGSHAIKLQGDQFEFAGPQQEALLVKKEDAPTGLAPLMERFAHGGIFEIGLGKTTGKQPRQFNVNPTKLFNHPKFVDRLEYALRRSLPKSLAFVILSDDDAAPLAEKIVTFSETSPTVLLRGELNNIPVETKSSVLVVASAIESGRALLDISRDLRSSVPDAPILYLVGFSKVTGEPRREALARTLTQTHHPQPYQVVEIEKLVLPVSSENNAWADELRLLNEPDVKALVPARLRARIERRSARLRKTSLAMTNDLFVSNKAGGALKLQPGFVFWPDGVPQRGYSQADVYFTIAAVLQRLRANAHVNGKSAIKSNWFQQTILAPENFGRFNDDIIQACILRASYPFEMNFAEAPKESRELGRLIRRIILASAYERGGAASEFLLAIATRRLRLRDPDLETVLDADPGAVLMVKFFQDVCRARLRDGSA
ncbi:hypothetical protein GCM10011611_66210 [Aliidongia dinghuensis]|uniref:Uncharacterized protein n=1 Tax=Aliidongia dinghuensis TaxID=1867774 RepID=A0A8J2Z1Y0_9PROT|nr:hypothetical protein [Aliidongia dinghuensis]GGF50495.1 hypothetical protein GCM10011611_66210 [Aliidongia dinghuensis]